MQLSKIYKKLTPFKIKKNSKFTIKKIGSTEGYDGHCLRAYSYFKNQMPDIDPNSVDSINSIKDKYPHLRQLSKVPTFALTYAGTWATLVKNAGLDKKTAIEIEKAYHELYSVSDKWVENKLKQATKTGFVELAFGLKLRTPILNYTVTGNKYTPSLASAEGRTAGNALGQSYGLLTNRACMEFMNQVRNSKYKYDIHPVAQIHDAIYLLIKEDINVLKYTNDNLIKAMNWQDDPNIYHDKVKLDAELGVYYPNWSNEIILKNNICTKEIYNTINK